MRTRYAAFILAVLSSASLFIGNIPITFGDLISLNGEKMEILFLTRIPRLAAVLITGAGMSICGLIMQHITRNRFVSPTTGASVNSAHFGLLVATIFFSAYGYISSLFFAAAFAMAGTFAFVFLIRRIKVRSVEMIPLLGIMLGLLIEAMATFLAYRYNMVESLSAWMIGSFTWVISGRYELLFLSVPMVVIAFIYANKFTVAGMGEEMSLSLGLKYDQVVNIGLGITSVVTAVVVIIVGAVPFLDLIVPNIVSMMKGDNLRRTIWDTAIFGALFLLICDVFSRLVIFPFEVPIGLTVGVIGSITFLILLFRRRAYER